MIVTENTFGDILSDEASARHRRARARGVGQPRRRRPGIFEPVHGSAPDIAGHGIANPAAMLRSAALMLEHGLGRPDEAAPARRRPSTTRSSAPTPDLGGTATTAEVVAAVLEELAVDGPAVALPLMLDAARPRTSVILLLANLGARVFTR